MIFWGMEIGMLQNYHILRKNILKLPDLGNRSKHSKILKTILLSSDLTCSQIWFIPLVDNHHQSTYLTKKLKENKPLMSTNH
jgi:hypothetical protein